MKRDERGEAPATAMNRRAKSERSAGAIRRPLVEGLLAALAVLLVTALVWAVNLHPDKASLGLIYLLVVALSAALGGTRPALVAAFTSFLVLNYISLPPIYTFIIHDPRDVLLLAVFLIIGILVGQLMGRMRRREEEALARERDMAALYRAVVLVNETTDLKSALATIADQILSASGAQGCAFFTGSPDTPALEPAAAAGDTACLESPESRRLVQRAMKEARAIGLCAHASVSGSGVVPWPATVSHEEALGAPSGRSDVFLPMQSGGRTVGLLYAAPPEGGAFGPAMCRLLAAFASNCGAFIERTRLVAEAAHGESLRETERLKSLLLSSISHNLKTPLASMAATLSSLRHDDVQWEPAALEEQLSLMEEDMETLTEHIENLLHLAHLESGTRKPRQECFELRDIVTMALRRLPQKSYERLTLDIPEELPLVWVDGVQISQVVRHVLENALEYSPPGTPILLAAEAVDGGVRVVVDDEGPGVSDEEREKIFQKFYRGKAASGTGARGTGLGLAICREILQANGGRITVEQPSRGGRFTVLLPVRPLCDAAEVEAP